MYTKHTYISHVIFRFSFREVTYIHATVKKLNSTNKNSKNINFCFKIKTYSSLPFIDVTSEYEIISA